MSLLDLLLLISIFSAALYMGYVAYLEKRSFYRILALVLCTLGLLLTYAQGNQFVATTDTVKIPAIEHKSVRTEKQRVVLLDPHDSSLAGEKIDLSTTAIADKWNQREQLKGSVMLLDASRGLLPENQAVLEQIFTDLKMQAATDNQIADVCWIRNAYFTVSSGLCEQRAVKWLLHPSEEDLTRSHKSFATVRIAEQGKTRWVLVTHSFSEQKPSVEEQCLLGLAQGKACAVVEVLPSAATAALHISSYDPTIQSVLEEFAAAMPKDLNEALSIYSNAKRPLIENVAATADSTTSECGGIFLQPETRLKVLNLDPVTAGLREADTESKLSKEAKNLTNYLNCPGLSHLVLPKFKKRDVKVSARSFMTYAMKHSFWFTDDKSYLNRLLKIQNVSLQTDDTAQKINIQNTNDIKELSLSFILPERYPEEMLQSIAVRNPGSSWNVYRMGTYGFRLSFDKASSNAVIDLTGFFKALHGNQLGIKNFLGSVGVLPALQIAFILAVLLSFVHITASKRAVGWIFTFAPVSVIVFILVFLSIVSSRLPSGSDTSLARMEYPTLPQHIFLRDWPDAWFEKVQLRDAGIMAAAQRQTEKWAQALRAGSQKSFSGDQNVTALSADIIMQESVAGERGVTVWDHPQARNFYFRKSSVYQSAILGWREIAKSNDKLEISSAGDFSSLQQLAKNSVLIVPDIRFLSDSDLAGADKFVKGGGILVFSEKLEPEDANGGFSEQTAFVNALKDAGYGKTQAANYSKVNIAGLAVNSINVAHRVVAPNAKLILGQRWGNGSVVFAGAQPLDSQSRNVLAEIVARLQGKQVEVRDVGAGCATALFVQPWGASSAELESLSRLVRQAGYDLRWLLDPVSLAKMAPQWENRLRADGVAFLDDGKAATRNLAAELLKTLQGPTAKPVFVTLESTSQKDLSGPASELINARTMTTSDAAYQAGLWKSECYSGLATPRFLTATAGASLQQAAQVLRAQGPHELLGLNNYLQRLYDLRSQPAGEDKKFLKYKIENPLELMRE